MVVQKHVIIFLVVVCAFGTIANWLLKLHDGSVDSATSHMKLRISQLQDECTRKLAEQKEEFQQSWKKKLKELENSRNEIVEKDKVESKDKDSLQDDNRKLMEETESLRKQLDALRSQYGQYKHQMEVIANVVQGDVNKENGSKNHVEIEALEKKNPS